MLKVTIEPQAVRIGPRFAVAFQRTLRIPDDGRTYPLPPGFGPLPVYKVEDFIDRVPAAWREQGGAFIPMYQREALWLSFAGPRWHPNAAKVAIGGVNALSGEREQPGLRDDPQNYIVTPNQPWLDGIKTAAGSIRQFVAMPLGLGYTVEAAFGPEVRGGIQITVYQARAGRFPDQPPPDSHDGIQRGVAAAQPMGLGAGGVIRQKIYPDSFGIDTWEQADTGTAIIHIINSTHFRELTGLNPPPTPIDTAAYAAAGLPWFDLYDEHLPDVAPSERLAGAKTIAERDQERDVAEAKSEVPEIGQTRIKKLKP